MQAGSFYAGAELGYSSHRFTPEYNYTYDRPNSEFANMAYSSEIGWLGGYRFNLNDLFSGALQVRMAFSTADWSIDTDSPASLSYRIPYAAFISIQPDIALTKTLSLMLEAGAAQGLVKEKKDSPSSSRYDFSDWTTGYLGGVGLKFHFVEGVSFFAIYRYVAYDQIDYRTFLPDGTHWETVSDNPSSTTINLGFSWDFDL
ncbi:MAG: outer membrane protein [Desulfatirhabdiaceae bacterium]